MKKKTESVPNWPIRLGIIDAEEWSTASSLEPVLINSQDVKGKNCAFYDKRTKLCMFVGLYVLNNFGYRGIAEKSYDRNKPV